jgi:hypothetical protein
MGNDGSMRNVRPGTNGFACMIVSTDKRCSDANSMEFFHAMMKHEPPPDKAGISRKLRILEPARPQPPREPEFTCLSLWGCNFETRYLLSPSTFDGGVRT